MKFNYDNTIKVKDRAIESFKFTSEMLVHERTKYEIVLELMKEKDSVFGNEFEKRLHADDLISEIIK
jgi:ketosteroid isomerase-like protein